MFATNQADNLLLGDFGNQTGFFFFGGGGGGRVDSVLKTHMLVELQDWSRGGEGQFHFFVQLYIYIRPNSFRIMPLIELSSQLR